MVNSFEPIRARVASCLFYKMFFVSFYSHFSVFSIFSFVCFQYGKTALDFAESFGRKVWCTN